MKLAIACLVVLVAGGCKKKEEPAKEQKEKGKGSGSAKAKPAVDAAAKPTSAADAAAAAPAVVDAGAAAAAPAKALPPLEDGEMPSDWWDAGCVRVMRRLGECSSDPELAKALKADAEQDEIEEIDARVAGLKNYADPERIDNLCVQLSSVTYEDEGFLDGDWRGLDDEAVLGDCARLGREVVGLGGLFGGSTDS